MTIQWVSKGLPYVPTSLHTLDGPGTAVPSLATPTLPEVRRMEVHPRVQWSGLHLPARGATPFGVSEILSGWCFQPTKEKYGSNHPQVRVENQDIFDTIT